MVGTKASRLYLFIHVYKLVLCLLIFFQTEPSRRLHCSAPSTICHVKGEESCYVPLPRVLQANLPAFSQSVFFVISAKYVKSIFKKFFV